MALQGAVTAWGLKDTSSRPPKDLGGTLRRTSKTTLRSYDSRASGDQKCPHRQGGVAKLTVYCLDKISETPFERDIISSNCECCVTSFINLVKEAAYPICLILSRKSKGTVDVAKIFFVCRMSMAI